MCSVVVIVKDVRAILASNSRMKSVRRWTVLSKTVTRVGYGDDDEVGAIDPFEVEGREWARGNAAFRAARFRFSRQSGWP